MTKSENSESAMHYKNAMELAPNISKEYIPDYLTVDGVTALVLMGRCALICAELSTDDPLCKDCRLKAKQNKEG